MFSFSKDHVHHTARMKATWVILALRYCSVGCVQYSQGYVRSVWNLLPCTAGVLLSNRTVIPSRVRDMAMMAARSIWCQLRSHWLRNKLLVPPSHIGHPVFRSPLAPIHAAKVIALATKVAHSVICRMHWLHPFLKQFLPAPGQGPSREAMTNGCYRFAVIGYSQVGLLDWQVNRMAAGCGGSAVSCNSQVEAS